MIYIDHSAGAGRWNAAQRIRYVHVVTVISFASGILFSHRLWFGTGRTFPPVPVFDVLFALPAFVDAVLSIALLASLALSIFREHATRWLAAAVGLALLLILKDQTRLQPWVFQYVVMLAVVGCDGARESDRRRASQLLGTAQLVLISLYFWSGAQKLNWSFGHDVLPALLESAKINLPFGLAAYLPICGLAVASCEMSIGVGLLVRRTRQRALLLAVGMHVLLLSVLLASWRNSVIWPWNIGMIAMAVLLFRNAENSLAIAELRGMSRTAMTFARGAVLLLCSVAPAFSFAGWWDLYLSAALYSGLSPAGVLRISERVRDGLPPKVASNIFTSSRGELMLPLYEWCMSDLNVPPYPETRAYRKVAGRICALAEDPVDVELIIKERPSLIDGVSTVTRLDCSRLSGAGD